MTPHPTALDCNLTAQAAFTAAPWLDAGWWDKRAMEYSYKLERNLRVAKLRLEGKSYAAIGRSEGINGCRVKQIITDLMRRVERRQAWLKASNNQAEARGTAASANQKPL